MPVDPVLAERIRDHLSRLPAADLAALTERKMFGGIGWMIHRHMATGAHGDGRLMIRCAKEDWPELVDQPGAGPMVQGGRRMTGWVLVDAAAVADDASLAEWIDLGTAYAGSLPPNDAS